MVKKPEKRITVVEAAEVIGCARGYVRQLIREGRIPGFAVNVKAGSSERFSHFEIPLSAAKAYRDTVFAKGWKRGRKRG